MELKLKSLLTAPKLKSGAKAFALALSFVFLPFWAFAAIFAAVYLSPFVFPVSLVLTAAAVAFALHYFASAFGYYWAFFVALDVFYALFAVKDYAVAERSKIFSLLASAVFLIILYGFFTGTVSLLLLFLGSFAVSADLLSFYPEKNKHYPLAGVLALIAAEVGWVVSLAGLSSYFSVAAAFGFIFSAAFAFAHHLKGTLLGTNALYLSLAMAIVSALSVFIALLS